jgi:UDP-3-O-[3-hydroxymyristoyl] glucosamine N-acyltransferase
MNWSLNEIVAKLGGEIIGDSTITVNKVASLAHAKAGQISFLSNAKYRGLLSVTQASAVVMSHAEKDACLLPRIITDNPYAYFARLSALLNPVTKASAGVDPLATVHANASVPESCSVAAHAFIASGVHLADNVEIGAGVYLGEGVSIGAGSKIDANAVIYHHCSIGQRCVIGAGTVIGGDGFGYAESSGQWIKIPQVGGVIIEDDVEIGANTTIDRGAIDDTVIEQGSKIDNLVQIGHNCRVGAHTVIAGCVGLAGSANIGKHCKIGGAAMILGHLSIADGVTITPGSMITRSISASDTYTALMPFQTHDAWLKTAANIKKLGELAEKVKLLEKEIKAIKSSQ